jgi:APA family basic amino acid/polyamine antiporter
MSEKLPRFLGPWEAALFTVAWTIGSAVFRVPGEVATSAGSISTSLTLWALGGVLSLCGALCYAEMAVRVPRSGSEYRYLYAAYGPMLAFVFAWSIVLSVPAAVAAVARAFADYLAVLWPLGEVQRRVASASAIAVLAIIAMLSTRAGTRIASVTGVSKILAILGLAYVGITVGANTSPTVAAVPAAGFRLAHLGTAMVAIIWAYDGFSSVTNVAGEVRTPQRTLPIGILVGLGIVTLAYLLLNVVYFHVLGFQGVATSDSVASKTLAAMFGPIGGQLIACFVIASVFGTLAAQVVALPRYFMGPAEDGLFPGWLAKVNRGSSTPANAILALAGIAIMLVALGGYDVLLRLYVLAFYPLVVVALFGAVRLRRRDGVPTGFAMPLYPLPLVVFAAGIAAICIASVFDDPSGALFGLAVPASGAIVYLASSKWRLARP